MLRLFALVALFMAFGLCAEDEPVKITEIKMKDGTMLHALRMSVLSANGVRSYSVVSIQNKRLGLQEKDVVSHKEITVPFAELPEPARLEIAKQRAAAAPKEVAKAPEAVKAPPPTVFAPAFQKRTERPEDPAVDKALAWLAANQLPDGRWTSTGEGAQLQQDTAVTGLAMMAFLGAGHSEKTGEYKDTVRKGIIWLKTKQSADGLIYEMGDDKAMHRAKGYPHAIAMTAMCEAAGMNGAPDTKMAAQKAVDYAVMKHQHPDGGWRYTAGMEGCLSVSGWYAGGLKAAKAAGMRIPPANLALALKFLENLNHRIEGGGDTAGSVFWYMKTNEHSQTAYRLTVIGHAALASLERPDPGLRNSVEHAVGRGGLPKRGANGETADMYYWYYGTIATQYAGGELETKWRDSMLAALAQGQSRDGPTAGSFHPEGDFAGEWGRTGQTALAVICLVAPWRYGKPVGK